MHKKKWGLCALLVGILLILTACGKDEQLDIYKESLITFSESITQKSDEIDMIDPFSETAVSDLLAKLDEMEILFSDFAQLEVPKQFENNIELADEASSYMTEAVTLYHTAFESESYDSYAAEAAKENYNRAMKRVEYIADVLRGKIPDGENIQIITEEDNGTF